MLCKIQLELLNLPWLSPKITSRARAAGRGLHRDECSFPAKPLSQELRYPRLDQHPELGREDGPVGKLRQVDEHVGVQRSWELREHRSGLVAAPLQRVQSPADPGVRMGPSASLVGPLVIVPIIICVRSACLPPRLLLVGPLVILSIMKCPRSLFPPPALACLRVGPLVIAREIMGLWSPSLCPSYNLVLYKVRSSPCCASGCYSECWGEGQGEGWGGEEWARGGWGSVASH